MRVLAAMLGATVALAMFWLLVEPVSFSANRSLLKNSIYRQEFAFSRQGSLPWSNCQWRLFAARQSLNLQELIWDTLPCKARQFTVKPNPEQNSISLAMRCLQKNNNALAAFQEVTDAYVRQYNTNASTSALHPDKGNPLNNNMTDADGSEKILRDWLKQQDDLYEEILKQMKLQEKSPGTEGNFRRSILQEKLDRIKESMTLVGSLLPSKPAGKTETASASVPETICPATEAKKPLLQVNSIVTSCGLSRLGYLALTLSVFVGIGLGLILYPARRKYSDMDDIEDQHESPKISDIPAITESDDAALVSKSSHWASSPAVDQDNLPEQQSDSNQQTSSWPLCYDRLAETIEKLADEKRAIVLISALDTNHATPRAAVNLAIALSRRQHNILLIEADAGSSDLAAVFDVDGDDISDTDPDDQQISSGSPEGFFQWRQGNLWTSKAVIKTSLPGVDFMPAGTPSQQQCADDFDLSREQHRWGNLRGNYDAILLYCPAALSSGEDSRQIVASQLLDLADTLVALTADDRNLSAQTEKIETILQGHIAVLLDLVTVKL